MNSSRASGGLTRQRPLSPSLYDRFWPKSLVSMRPNADGRISPKQTFNGPQGGPPRRGVPRVWQRHLRWLQLPPACPLVVNLPSVPTRKSYDKCADQPCCRQEPTVDPHDRTPNTHTWSPLFAQHSIDDGKKVEIAAIHPDLGAAMGQVRISAIVTARFRIIVTDNFKCSEAR